MNIVVLAGGISTEREVSIVSGTQVCKALREKGHRAILLDVYFGNEQLQAADAFHRSMMWMWQQAICVDLTAA